MVPIRIVLIDFALAHSFQNFVDDFYLTIGLGEIWGGEVMFEA